MKEISKYIAEGAMAFLKAEWKILRLFRSYRWHFTRRYGAS